MNRLLPILSLMVVGLALLIHSIPSLELVLRYERAAIQQGEFWRLFTCHWCHISGAHLFWNMILALIVGGMLERRSRLELVATIGLGLMCIAPLLFVALPEMTTYVGLSGIVAGLVASVTLDGLMKRDRNTWIWIAIAALLTSKIVLETIDPRLLLTQSDSHRSVPLAHLLGVASGLLATIGTRWFLHETPPHRSTTRPSLRPG